MKKQLFFDDNKLFGRNNVTRKYGKPQLVSVYNDGVCSTDYCTGFVFRLDNGKYRMLYFGHSNIFSGKKLFAAESCNGIDFTPECIHSNPSDCKKTFAHEIMDIPSEVACIYEDKHTDNPNERYKMLMSEYVHEELSVHDTVYTSSDLINWQLKEGALWGDGTEPLVSVFYNSHKNVHTIIQRPFWGIRCAGYKETSDWENFSEYRYCLNVDVCDERLAEIYGMYAFEYDGMYIGVPHMYRQLESEFNAKYKNGIIDTQLAYSYDGRYWQRSLRVPFISGVESESLPLKKRHGLVWVSNAAILDDGDIYFYASASEHDHGPAFSTPGTGKMFVYRLRRDGFIALCSDDKALPSSVITREKIWHGGEISFNLKAQHATVAVYVSDESELVSGNMLGVSKPVAGYGHDDCVPFCGDSTAWIPQFANGRKIDDLKGNTLVFELRFTNGKVYSLCGDYTDVFNTQAGRYRRFGVLPK